MTSISSTSIEAALSPNVKAVKPRCPDCGESVDDFYDHVDLDCCGKGLPNLYPDKKTKSYSEMLDILHYAEKEISAIYKAPDLGKIKTKSIGQFGMLEIMRKVIERAEANRD